MIRTLCTLLILTPLAVSGASGGAWSAKSAVGTVSGDKRWVKSKSIKPRSPLPARAVATRLHWSINTSRLPPEGFIIRLCGGRQCFMLPSLSGQRDLPPNFPAAGPISFEYIVTVRGPLRPPLTVFSNEATVSYRLP